MMGWVLWLWCGFVGPYLNGDILVIASPDTPIDALTLRQVRQIYLKKMDRLGAVRITPLNLPKGAPVRRTFEERLFAGRIHIENYWLEQKVLAEALPPLEVKNEAYLLVFVARNPGFVGYVSASHRRDIRGLGLRVLAVLPAGSN